MSVSNFPTTTKLLGMFVFIQAALHILLSTVDYSDWVDNIKMNGNTVILHLRSEQGHAYSLHWGPAIG